MGEGGAATLNGVSTLATHRVEESVETFHHRPFSGEAAIWIPDFGDETALVLGSRQDRAVVDTAAAQQRGVTVTDRRSGGGAVLVSAADLVWFDVIIPVTDPRFDQDVRRSFDWLGVRLLETLDQLGVAGGVAHHGALIDSKWSDLICFAGLGPGEVSVDGRKIVGVSQRRTRDAARFQVAILRRWEPARIVDLLALSPTDRQRAIDDLADVAAGITADPDDILAAAIQTLNR